MLKLADRTRSREARELAALAGHPRPDWTLVWDRILGPEGQAYLLLAEHAREGEVKYLLLRRAPNKTVVLVATADSQGRGTQHETFDTKILPTEMREALGVQGWGEWAVGAYVDKYHATGGATGMAKRAVRGVAFGPAGAVLPEEYQASAAKATARGGVVAAAAIAEDPTLLRHLRPETMGKVDKIIDYIDVNTRAAPVAERLPAIDPDNRLPGGRGDKLAPADVNPRELAMGIKVEREHTPDPGLCQEIALDHLSEDPAYYTHLAEMEDKYQGASEKLSAAPAERWPDASEVQTVLFDRGVWSEEEARAWLHNHKFGQRKIDVTERYLRFRQHDPQEFGALRTIEFGEFAKHGIKAVVGPRVSK